MLQLLWKIAISCKIKYKLIPPLCIYLPKRKKNICPWRNLYIIVHGSFIHNNQKVETVKCSTTGKWGNKYWYVHVMKCHSAMKGQNYMQQNEWDSKAEWKKPEEKEYVF